MQNLPQVNANVSERQMSLAFMTILHAASVALYCFLPMQSPLRNTAASPAYWLRLAAVLALLTCYLGNHRRHGRVVGFYLLLSGFLDCFRVHTMWTAALASEDTALDQALCAVQSTIIIATAVYLVYEAATPLIRTQKGDPVRVNEQASSTVGMLMFGWVWPLVARGRTGPIAEADIEHVSYHSRAIYRESHAAVKESRKSMALILLDYSFAMILKLLSALATLGQPLLVGAVVTFLQSSDATSRGIWLVIVMFVE